MRTRGMARVLRWIEVRCAGRRLRSGSRRREHLLRRLGRLGEAGARHRMDAAGLRRQGEAVCRRFKWDQAAVPAEARALCRQVAQLEDRLSHLARAIGSAAPRAARGRPAGAPRPRAEQAGVAA